jgi:hypothetical protein
MNSLYFVPTNNTVDVHGSHFPVSELHDCQEWAGYKRGPLECVFVCSVSSMRFSKWDDNYRNAAGGLISTLADLF